MSEIEDLQKAYREAGVHPQKAGDLLRPWMKSQREEGPLPAGFFCRLLPLAGDEKGEKTYLALSTDGVGTKLLLALKTGRIEGLGQDLVAMVYNDIITSGARPLAFLDYYATGELDEEVYPVLIESIHRACLSCQMPLVGGETAEMPGLYQKGHFDMAGFAVGVAREGEILSPEKVKGGQVLIGLPSSGFHSNGFSLLRKILDQENIDLNQPAPGGGKTLAESLLAPTRIYREVRDWKREETSLVALAHITGGGYYENLPRILPSSVGAVLNREAFRGERFELFDWFASVASLSWSEMAAIFNCGYGMVAVVKEDDGRWDQRLQGAKKIGYLEEKKRDSPIIRWKE